MTELARIAVAGNDISVPVDKKTLGQFISGLLGQPQTLEQKIEAPFCVDHAWLIHLCSLLFQRINQQNAPEPLNFEAVIYYENGFSRKISSFSAFQHFTETQSIVASGIRITLGILIHFPGKEIPEKQEISIALRTNSDGKQGLFESILGKSSTLGLTRIEIRHTERTWADDIYALIAKELETVQSKEGNIKPFLRKVFFPFSSFLLPLSMMCSLVYSAWQKNAARDEFRSKIELITENKIAPNLQLLNEKINLLLLSQDGRFASDDLTAIVPLITSLFISIILIFIGVTLAQPTPSFLLLSRASERKKQNIEARQKRKVIFLLGSMFISLVLGIAGNFIYDHIK